MLPTEQKFNIGQYIISKYPENLLNGKLISGIKKYEGNINEINQHLYIISDDEIKEGDWKYNEKLNCITQHLRYNKNLPDDLLKAATWCKKIIATTDTSLFKLEDCPVRGANSSVKYISPQPSQQFIEKYIESYNKGEVITNVLVEYEDVGEEDWDEKSDEPIWKEKWKLRINPKDNTITIKKLKNSWNREEVRQLMINSYKMSASNNLNQTIEWIDKTL